MKISCSYRLPVAADIITVVVCLVLCFHVTRTAKTAETDRSVASPDGFYQFNVSLGDDGAPLYSVTKNGQLVIAQSRLGFVIKADDRDVSLSEGVKSIRVIGRSTQDRTWQPVWGERSSIRDFYHSARFRFDSPHPFDLEVRAYNEGVAFRYHLVSSDDQATISIRKENTEFAFSDNHDVWSVTSAQGRYSRLPLAAMNRAVERPCVLETSDGTVIAVGEAALVDFARMRLRHKDDEHTLTAALHGENSNEPAVVSPSPLTTPWRFVMVEKEPGKLIENNFLLLNLNKPSQIKDTSWIRPGKVIREVTLSTKGGKACVDFAVKYGLQFVEYDAGWYGPQDDERSDARTVSRPGLDLQEVINYAKERDIGIIVYVNRRHLESQLDDLLPLYKSWGIAGIKYGFVQHGSQKWTAWLHEAVAKTARYQIMVDVHDEYRMTGWQRTYPNFMTAEGIGGDETRPTNHQVLVNLFTRMIAAPADHTFCYYNGYVDQTTSHGSQLAKTVCMFSPWQFLFWYDQPSAANDEPELQFFKYLPTTWDETRVLQGKIGEHAVVARRSGEAWFVGCLNSGTPREFTVPFSFLDGDREYLAEIYHDDPSVPTRTHVGIRRQSATSHTVLHLPLTDRGGAAIRIVPKSSTVPKTD